MSETQGVPFDWMRDSGWGAINEATRPPTRAEIDAHNQEAMRHHEEAKAVFACFNAPEGRAALEWLRRRTIETPTFIPGSPHSEHYGFFRSGENNIYFEILQMMQEAQEPPQLKAYPDDVGGPTEEG